MTNDTLDTEQAPTAMPGGTDFENEAVLFEPAATENAMTGQSAAVPPDKVTQKTKIDALVKAMARESGPHEFIEAGYTYFGQFIAHDIVEETHPRRGTKRSIQPGMNLDSLYGTDCADLLDGKGLFPQTGHDVPRCCGDRPKIPELRNDENVIVAQLHRFWQRFHNFVIASGCAGNATEARRLVTLVFQLIVVEDYLRQVLDPRVFESYFRVGGRWLGFDVTSVPPVFSHAAFRFGHSMVRSTYDLSAKNKGVALEKLFMPTQPIDASLAIDWRLFFGWNDGVQLARPIDPYVVPEMKAIGGGEAPTNIIEMNLRSGFEASLPPGKAYARSILASPNGKRITAAFNLTELRNLVPLKLMPGGLTENSGVTIDNLPLWPYILTEAKTQGGGRHLGILGSLICAEVLSNSIAVAQYSILPDGKPAAFDQTLGELGALGRRIDAVRRANAHRVMNARALSMRHLIELIEGPAN